MGYRIPLEQKDRQGPVVTDVLQLCMAGPVAPERGQQMSDEIATLKRQLKKEGYEVVPDGQGHWRVRRPGQRGFLTALPASTRDQRVVKNFRRDLRRAEAGIGASQLRAPR